MSAILTAAIRVVKQPFLWSLGSNGPEQRLHIPRAGCAPCLPSVWQILQNGGLFYLQPTPVEYKQLYQHANREARAITDRYRRYRAIARKDRQERLQQHMGELFQERLEAGYEEMSAREVLPRLSTELKSLRNIYRNIAKVVAAND